MPKNTNIYFTTLVNISLLISCSEVHSSKNDYNDPMFVTNARFNELDKAVQYIVSGYDFSIIFFTRAEANYGWYKILARKGVRWEKIEYREAIMDEQQMKVDPGFYISRDITTRKLCHSEEAKSFLGKLKASGLFELQEEKILFKDCKDSGVTDQGAVYIQIVSDKKVRELRYSEVYKCPGKEWDSIRKIENLFETDWFENSKGR